MEIETNIRQKLSNTQCQVIRKNTELAIWDSVWCLLFTDATSESIMLPCSSKVLTFGTVLQSQTSHWPHPVGNVTNPDCKCNEKCLIYVYPDIWNAMGCHRNTFLLLDASRAAHFKDIGKARDNGNPDQGWTTGLCLFSRWDDHCWLH